MSFKTLFKAFLIFISLFILLSFSDYYCEGNDLSCHSANCIDHFCREMDHVPVYIDLIFDNSASMSGEKIEKAKEYASYFLDHVNEDNVRLKLYVFDGCEVKGLTNFTNDKHELLDKINELTAESSTPLANAIEFAFKELKEKEGRRVVVLFTDGEDTCSNVSPCSLINNATTKFPIYVIGYIVGESTQLECIAKESGGEYITAPTSDTLKDVFEEVGKKLIGVCHNDTDCFSDEVCVSGSCEKAKLHILFMPINDIDLSLYEQTVQEQYEFLLQSLPSLKGCEDRVRITKLMHPCYLYEPKIEDSEYVFNMTDICAWASHHGEYSYDIIVGVVDASMGDVVGYTTLNGSHILISPGYEVSLAHEFGHDFGLLDEYCACPPHCNTEPNPLLPEYGCDVNGGCCWQDKKFLFFTIENTCSEPYGCGKCCWGNKNEKGGRSIMSYANAPGPRWHDEPSLDHLEKFEKLRCEK